MLTLNKITFFGSIYDKIDDPSGKYNSLISREDYELIIRFLGDLKMINSGRVSKELESGILREIIENCDGDAVFKELKILAHSE
ncbi:hypothetical protein [Fluviicola sp.]|uniref:hypothetical protein n=1 Tax=Fluviicola sp. TaxID=1917219 RepID=UPI0031DAC197